MDCINKSLLGRGVHTLLFTNALHLSPVMCGVKVERRRGLMIQSVRTTAFAFLLFLACLRWPSRAEAGQPPADTGTFRFLTQSLPDGSTNAVYSATLLTANASGAVTYSSNPSPPVPGVTLDPTTGFITGRPTVVNGSGFDVTFTATDGTTPLQLVTKIRVTSS